MMQISFQYRVKPTLIFSILILFSGSLVVAQNSPDLTFFRSQIDSLYKVSEKLCNADSTSKLASSWVLKSNSILAIMDDAELKERYSNLDLQVESARALIRITELDKNNQYRLATETNLATSTIDLSNLGRESLEASRKFNSSADAERSSEYFQLCLETYKLTGASQKVVDNFWREESISWQWIRFFKAVASRKSGRSDFAEKEYSTLIKIGWEEPVVFLELADLYTKSGKAEEAQKTLVNAYEKLPENIPLACTLAKLYLSTDQLKKAQAVIKPFDHQLGYNAELVLTKALIYEKRGDFKKADAMFKAVHKSDPNEVHINSIYAGYLMRKTKGAEPFDAEEFAQLAYTLMHQASELSPQNSDLLQKRDDIKKKYPKVKLEETE